MGEFADFMSQDMPKAETVLSTMNGHAVFLENRFAGQPTELLGAVLFELCKFCVRTPRSWIRRACVCVCVALMFRPKFRLCVTTIFLTCKVPLLPLDTSASGRRPPFLFSKTTESTAYIQAQQRLSCPISGAVFIRKVTLKASAASASTTATSDKKKRAHVPDLSTDAVPKKAARKAKAKTKAKAKAQALQFDAETPQDLQGSIDFNLAEGFSEQDQAQNADAKAKETDAEGHGQGSRQRLWLDDMLSAVERCLTGPYAVFQKSPATKTMRAVVISLALEFACSGTVVLRKKPLKVWSQAMESMHDCVFFVCDGL